MFRRNFITRFAIGSAATIGTMNAGDSKTVTYRITGFSCITCAVGLDTLLSQTQGVLRSKSNYPQSVTTIEFRPSVITEEALKACIAEMGFTAK